MSKLSKIVSARGAGSEVDLLCVHRRPCRDCCRAVCFASGVEYGVVRATFQQQLQQMLLTVLALWIPLIPLLFLAQRLVDNRNGTRRAKSANPNAPRVTFADVAGKQAAPPEVWLI